MTECENVRTVMNAMEHFAFSVNMILLLRG
jgi:hypothetical protein